MEAQVPGFFEGLLRILGGEPWSERRVRQRRAAEERRKAAAIAAPERRRGERRKDERRGRGWLRFWTPP